MNKPTIHDLEMSVEGLRKSLERAAGAIQSFYVGAGHQGISGEAVIALASAIQERSERWDEATTRARAKLTEDFPSNLGRLIGIEAKGGKFVETEPGRTEFQPEGGETS
jgi:hypothetical protein